MKEYLGPVSVVLISLLGHTDKNGAALIRGSANFRSSTAVVADSSLKDAFRNDFLTGTALNLTQIDEKDPLVTQFIPLQFNAITPENIMKCEVIQPGWDDYNFGPADRFVAYGRKHNMFIVGHTLIWHSQLSAFVKNIRSSDSLRLFMKNHIEKVARRYAGQINSWDVVNEALNEDGSLRKSIFLEKLGPDYIRLAFELAARAAPNTELYYNDYNIEQPQKRAGVIAMVKKLRESGTRIDGIGIQAHWSIKNIPLQDIEASIIAYSALGLKVSFTELDLTCLPNPWDLTGSDVNQNYENSPFMNPYPSGLPDSMQAKLTKSYEDLFRLFVRYKDRIERVTFWGVCDGQSWLNNWPVRGRTNYPLLFDRNCKPKPAYEKVMALSDNP